jgi:hypothetical protein
VHEISNHTAVRLLTFLLGRESQHKAQEMVDSLAISTDPTQTRKVTFFAEPNWLRPRASVAVYKKGSEKPCRTIQYVAQHTGQWVVETDVQTMAGGQTA